MTTNCKTSNCCPTNKSCPRLTHYPISDPPAKALHGIASGQWSAPASKAPDTVAPRQTPPPGSTLSVVTSEQGARVARVAALELDLNFRFRKTALLPGMSAMGAQQSIRCGAVRSVPRSRDRRSGRRVGSNPPVQAKRSSYRCPVPTGNGQPAPRPPAFRARGAACRTDACPVRRATTTRPRS